MTDGFEGEVSMHSDPERIPQEESEREETPLVVVMSLSQSQIAVMRRLQTEARA